MADMILSRKHAVRNFIQTLLPEQKDVLSILLSFDGTTNLLKRSLTGIPEQTPAQAYPNRVEQMLRERDWPEDAIVRERARL